MRRDWDRSETKKHTAEYICYIFWFAKQTSFFLAPVKSLFCKPKKPANIFNCFVFLTSLLSLSLLLAVRISLPFFYLLFQDFDWSWSTKEPALFMNLSLWFCCYHSVTCVFGWSWYKTSCFSYVNHVQQQLISIKSIVYKKLEGLSTSASLPPKGQVTKEGAAHKLPY